MLRSDGRAGDLRRGCAFGTTFCCCLSALRAQHGRVDGGFGSRSEPVVTGLECIPPGTRMDNTTLGSRSKMRAKTIVSLFAGAAMAAAGWTSQAAAAAPAGQDLFKSKTFYMD